MNIRPLLQDAAERGIRYLEALDARRVAPTADAVAALDAFERPLPEGPCDPGDTLRELDEIGSPATTAMAGPRFFGFVIGGSLPVTVATNWLSTAWDQNTGLHAPSPATAVLERIALDWMVDLFGMPKGTGGGFVTGATTANFTALAAARNAVLHRAGWNVEADGMFGAPSITVIIGDEAHPTLLKSLGMLGLGRNRVVRVPVDGQGRIRADALPAISGPTILCAQAGNVNSGAFDPFPAIVEHAHAGGAWVHVDAAFGLWALASPRYAHLAQGLTDADSWATDAHKWLNVPYDSGIAFVRDPAPLRHAMAITAEYLPTEGAFRNPSDYTPELSRRARGVDVWAALRTLGRTGIAAMIERCCAHAARFARELSAAGCTVLNDVVLNQVVVSFGDARTTRRVITGLQADGTLWCGPTVWQRHTAARISVSSWATTDDDVTRSIDAIARIRSLS